MRTQDDPSAGVRDFRSNCARWNGTSFAAPKVAGAVAARIAVGGPSASAKAAWNALRNVYGTASPNGELGWMFQNL
jgi:hypothetical protein